MDGWRTRYDVMKRRPDSDSILFDEIVGSYRYLWLARLAMRWLNRRNGGYYVAKVQTC